MIYPVDSIIHLLNNWGLMNNAKMDSTYVRYYNNTITPSMRGRKKQDCDQDESKIKAYNQEPLAVDHPRLMPQRSEEEWISNSRLEPMSSILGANRKNQAKTSLIKYPRKKCSSVSHRLFDAFKTLSDTSYVF